MCRASVGVDSLMGERPKDWEPVHQCEGRDGGRETVLSVCIQETAMLSDCRWILRVAGTGRAQATDVDRVPRQTTLRLCWTVGTLATPCRRADRVLHHPHNGAERSHGHNPHPDAGNTRPSSYEQWLDPAFQQVEALNALLRSFPAEHMIAFPVSTLVNNPRHDAPQCLEPA